MQGEEVPQAHFPSPHRALGSPPLSDSLGPAGGLSPQGRPRQPLRTHSVGVASAFPAPLPQAQAELGGTSKEGSRPQNGLLPPQHNSTALRHLHFCPEGRRYFWPLSDPLWKARWEVQG